jgi:putative transcriptional regulator
MSAAQNSDVDGGDGGLDLTGQFLVSMPGIGDERFERTVIFICAYSAEGAMGIIVNRRNPELSFHDVVTHLQIDDKPNEMASAAVDVPILSGGPVEANRGFVLHSADYDNGDFTLRTRNGIRMTATVDVLKSIADGTGPTKSLIALGYAGWNAGQLDQEILDNGWLNVDAEPDILFSLPFDARYDAALALLGIDGAQLSGTAGTA